MIQQLTAAIKLWERLCIETLIMLLLMYDVIKDCIIAYTVHSYIQAPV